LLPAFPLSYTTFDRQIGVPVQAFRTVAIIFIGYAMVRLLRIFEWERMSSIISANEELERKVEERTAQLVKANEELQLLIETEPECVKLLSADGSLLRMNRAGFSMLDAESEAQVLGKKMYALVDLQYRQAFKDLTDRVFRGESGILEFEITGLKGRRLWLETHAAPLRNERNEIIALLGITRDITERKQAEEALRESENRYHTLFNAIDEGFCIVEVIFDDNGKPVDYRFLETNPSFEKQTGLVVSQGKRMRELAPKHEEHWFRIYGEIAVTGEPARFQNQAAQLHRWYDVYAFRIGKPEDRQVAILFNDITERKEGEDKLKLTRFSVDHAAISAFLIGKDAHILYVNEQAGSSLGYSREELLEMTIPDLDPNAPMSAWPDIWARLKKEGRLRFESLHRKKYGTLIPVEITANYVSFGGREYDWAYSVDISERKRAEKEVAHSYELIQTTVDSMLKTEEALRKSEERLKRAQEIAHLGSWELDLRTDQLTWSDEVYRIFGLEPREFKPTYETFLEAVHPDDREAVDAAYSGTVREGRDTYEIEHRVVRRSDHEVRIVHEKCDHLRDESGKIIRSVGMVHDITDRRRMEDEIRHLAHHDALTGLPNRRLFRDITVLELAQARRNRRKIAILFLDLDRFKEINDTLGHEAGDELLKQAARLFRETIRESDTVARIGGDEFNIILADIVRPEDVSDIALKIIRRFRSPFSISGNELNVTTSIGISVYPDDSTEIDTLLRYSDIAMYHAKESGRNTFRFYNAAINVRSLERMRLGNMLRRSIDFGELVVYYQPQFDIQSRRMVCAEALVRWQHPEKGLLTPDLFLAQAEETGFITEIDEWALKTACSQVRSWVESGLPRVCITVNLSARQFEKPDLVGRISSILKETRMEPGHLNLEVTETTAMSDVDRSASQLRQLRDAGVHISIDDFGTGYSSLNYLKKLPIERLKIDKSFIRDIAHDPDDRAIISAVTSMARKMGIRTVAEGVETEEQLSFLRSTECDEVQGFLFSRPVASREFRELISFR
jgi:diguanylate cyclase (GGDEF)-like protein/PAS domain S-box-containing protein